MKIQDKYADVENWFKDHEATFLKLSDDTEKLVWKNPGSIDMMIVYILDCETLFVRGDLGSAVYTWEYDISIKGLRGVNP